MKFSILLSNSLAPVIRSKFLWGCFLTVVLFSCQKDGVSLEETNAKGEVPILGNLVFRFSDELATDSMLQRWDSTDYLSFEPAIAGKFRWDNHQTLIFSPAAPLLPAHTYTVRFNEKKLLQFATLKNLKLKSSIQFQTPMVQLEGVHAFWGLAGGSNTATPQVDLFFNYNINPSALSEKLKISVDGKVVPVEMLSVSTSQKISVRLKEVSPEDRYYALKVEIGKGLIPEKGKNGTTVAINSELEVSSPFELVVNEVTAEHNGLQGFILVRTNQELTPAIFSQFITVQPSVPFSTTLTPDGLLLTSEQWNADASYTLTFAKGLRGVVGGILKEDYSTSVAFGQLEPSLSFGSNQAMYLGKNGMRNLEIRAVNVPRIKIIISKIYENNLLMAERFGYYPQETEGEEVYYDEYDEGGNVMLGDIIFEQEVDTRSLPKMGSSRLLHFNLEDKVPDMRGIYHVKIRSTNDYWISDSRTVALSDIGLIVKQGQQKMWVFTNSIQTATGMQGVNILAYGANNQLLSKGITNAEGVAELTMETAEFAGFKPAMVVAKTADDLNYLTLQKTAVNTSRFEVGGKRIGSTGLDAFVCPERDMYRPGEQMNLAVVVRNEQWKSPGALPVKIRVTMPNGKELITLRKTLDAQGAAEANISLSESAITGSYLVEVLNGNDVLLASKTLKVETFMPDRLKVSTTLNHPSAAPGESLQLNIDAQNYFGPPAAGRNYECEIQVKRKSFSPAAYPQYQFDLGADQEIFDKQLRQGKTNEQGRADEKLEVPELYRNLGLLEAKFYSSVFDETGRPVSRLSKANLYTQTVFFGVGNSGYYYFPLQQQVRFPLIALNQQEQPVNATALVQVIKHDYRTVLAKSGSYFRYESHKEDKVVASANIQVNGQQSYFPFVPSTPGEYELRVRIPGANGYVSQKFYSYGMGGSADANFEVNREGRIDISIDKANYKPGEDIKALFKAPFDGRMLVTIETNKVVSYQYVQVTKRNAALTLKVNDQMLPNAFISATLIKAHATTEMPLTVATGFKNVNVVDERKRMPVSITAARNVRSKTRQLIKIKAMPNAMITLSAVDNGVLALSDFTSPDPFEFFFAPRALGVKPFNIYPLLFPELRRSMSSSGGDAALELKQRQNPLPNKRVKLLSYWSGIRKTNSAGEANFEVDIPSFSGEVRLMAVAVKEDNFGAASANMIVADPVVVSVALPRFLSPTDTVLMPVTISNNSKTNGTMEVKVQTENGLMVQGAQATQISIAASKEGVTQFKLAAGNSIGNATVKVLVKGLGETFTQEVVLSIRPAAPLQKMAGVEIIPANSQKQLNINTSDFIPASTRYDLTVSNSPLLQLGSQLQYLVQYPFGCTEQIISAALPQLYFSDLSQLLQAGKGKQSSAVEHVQEAIKRIKMRQLYNGSVTLWDGEGTESWWVSAYAAHFLWAASKAGYEVDQNLLETILNYLNAKLRNKQAVLYHYNGNEQRKLVPREIAYSLYVLSLAGRANISAMNYYKNNQKDLTMESRYLLAAALALAGDKQALATLLPASFLPDGALPESGGSFSSNIRDEALALTALLEINPNHPQVAVMAKHVTQQLQQRKWYSTQESAFALLALGKIAQQHKNNTATASIFANGKQVATMNGAAVRLEKHQLGSPMVSIKTSGNGPVYAWWQSQGISASGYFKQEDSYLKVRRSFYDRYGRAISGKSFAQNDLIVVKIALEKSYSGMVENVVVTDMLPAGFEVENARIKELPGTEWIKDAATPLMLDIRDDRVHFFTNLSGKQTFYYSVRAVTAGSFQWGPVAADAMYNGEYRSYNGGGTITVKPR